MESKGNYFGKTKVGKWTYWNQEGEITKTEDFPIPQE
jgi:hypothetical protein